MNNALWLENLEVLSMTTKGDTKTVKAAICVVADACPSCGVVGKLYRHGMKRRDFVDIPAYGHKVVIETEVQRFRCRDCKATFNQPMPELCEYRHMTTRCIDYIVDQAIPRTFSDVAREVGVNEKTVRNICAERFPEKLKARTYPPHISILGIDELMLDGEMRAIFMDVGRRSVLDVVSGHQKWQIARWISAMPADQRHFIRIVTIDMATSYRDVARALLPNAAIVVDKFHVQRCANQALDAVRNRARRNATGAGRRNPWRGQRLLRRRAHNLNPAQEMEVDGIIANNPLVQDAYLAKESFFAIWNARTKADAERAFDDWRAAIPKSVPEFENVAKMVQRWRVEVFAYFDYAATNAITENRNGLIKILNRAGRGYDFATIRAKALLTEHAKSTSCPICKTGVPVAAMREIGRYVPADAEIWNAYVCGSCHYVFNKVYVPFMREFDADNEHHLH